MEDAKQAGMDRAGELPVERRQAERRAAEHKPVAWGLLSIQDPELTNDEELAAYWERKGRKVTALYASPAVPVAAGLPATTEDEQNALLCKIEDYMNMTDKLGTQVHPDCTKAENDIYALVDEFLAKRAAAPVLPVEQPSQPQDQSIVMVDIDEVKQLCRDFSSLTGNVYIKDVEASLDGLAAVGRNSALHAEPAGQHGSGLLGEILVLAETGMCHGLTADDYCGQIVEKIKSASPIAEPDTATQAPSERLDTPDFQSLMLDFRAAPEYDAALYNKIMAAIYSWHQRTTQAVKPLTDEQIMRLAGDMKQRNAGVWPGDVAFARAIETHLKGD